MSTAAMSLSNDAMTETYKDVEMMIYKIVHRFSACYRMPFEDLLSEAHLTFVRAYQKYDPARFEKKAKFSSYLYFALSCDLRTFMKKQRKHLNLLEVKEEMVGSECHRAFRVIMESELSEDARQVVGMVLDTPSELVALFKWNRVKTPAGTLHSLREHLLHDVGWTARRVTRTFDEIRQALAA